MHRKQIIKTLQVPVENQCQKNVRSMKIQNRLNTEKYRSQAKEIKITLILLAMSKIPDPVFIFIVTEEFSRAGNPGTIDR